MTFRRAGFSICVHCWLSAMNLFWQWRPARQTSAWITIFSCVLIWRPALIRFRPYLGRSEAGGEDSMRFPTSDCNLWHKKVTRVHGCLLGEHPFDEEIILNKNKNKNKRVQKLERFFQMLNSFIDFKDTWVWTIFSMLTGYFMIQGFSSCFRMFQR